MGIHKSNFNAALFKRLPWQRFGLFNRISQLFENSKSHLFRLPVFKDIDTKKDAVALLNFSKSVSTTILSVLNAIANKGLAFFKAIFNIVLNLFSSPLLNKGSPYAHITA